ncbi:HLA class II histocompatibility antigen, DR beta 5 chain-like [Alligator mississippiensis]|uniref:HLA class II histocompatibility antigen, DR beta 5 chain-like n=1 Tax=Alligator mississippiensis TaxID=8496 RepID=A0A151P6D8_ALLMI|nr:HLA class II histocompatibility antigen, DR beta 5 chain-like [Alligator mississippiensis]
MGTDHFLYQDKQECYYTKGTQRARFLYRHIWNQQQDVHFDSDVGVFVADTELGEPATKHWNSQKDVLEYNRRSVDRFCQNSNP